MQNLAINYQMQRNFDAANKTIDRGLEIDPNGIGLREIKAKLAIDEKGDLRLRNKVSSGKSIPMNTRRNSELPAGDWKFSFERRFRRRA